MFVLLFCPLLLYFFYCFFFGFFNPLMWLSVDPTEVVCWSVPVTALFSCWVPVTVVNFGVQFFFFTLVVRAVLLTVTLAVCVVQSCLLVGARIVQACYCVCLCCSILLLLLFFLSLIPCYCSRLLWPAPCSRSWWCCSVSCYCCCFKCSVPCYHSCLSYAILSYYTCWYWAAPC